MPPTSIQIELFPDGFALVDGAGSAVADVRWAEIDQIATWKGDLVTFDEIILGFHRRETVAWLNVSEECERFMDLAEEMRRRFPAIAPDWYSRVMNPRLNPALAFCTRPQRADRGWVLRFQRLS